MNERILELAKTAGLKFPSETALSPVEEKFAELIVKDCIRMCNVAEVELLAQGLREESFGTITVKDLIRNHFNGAQ